MRKQRPQECNIHPGETLREEFLNPMELSAYQLAKRLHVPAPRINDIVLEKRGISADTAVRLAILRNDRAVLDEPAVLLRSAAYSCRIEKAIAENCSDAQG